MKHDAIAAPPNSVVDTLSGEGQVGVSTITTREAVQVERANASGAPPLYSCTGSGFCPPAGTAG
jgi:hypothetical protein